MHEQHILLRLGQIDIECFYKNKMYGHHLDKYSGFFLYFSERGDLKVHPCQIWFLYHKKTRFVWSITITSSVIIVALILHLLGWRKTKEASLTKCGKIWWSTSYVQSTNVWKSSQYLKKRHFYSSMYSKRKCIRIDFLFWTKLDFFPQWSVITVTLNWHWIERNIEFLLRT